MYSEQLSDLRTRGRQYCDAVNSNFVTDAILTGWVNDAIRELRDEAARQKGAIELYETTQTFSTVADQSSYTFASIFGTEDVVSVTGMDAQPNGTDWIPMRQVPFRQRNAGAGTSWYPSRPRYRVLGQSVLISPKPTKVYTARVRYIPEPTALSDAADTHSDVSTWREFVGWSVAANILAKEESDTSYANSQMQKYLQKYLRAVRSYDTEPNAMTDCEVPADDEAVWW